MDTETVDSARFAGREPIAIVGIGGRFPSGANSVEVLWQNLMNRSDMVGEWPRDRWDSRFFHADPERAGRVYTKAGGFLDQVDQFDADFFGMSPREASRLDPQQRLVLELAWTALEDSVTWRKV